MNFPKTKIFKSKSRIKKGLLPPVLLWHGKAEVFLDSLPENEKFDLIITSPPYNIGKSYEKPTHLDDYLLWQKSVIEKCLVHLKDNGSICWQVGNYLQKGLKAKQSSLMPLDIFFFNIFHELGLKLRNRIIWHFGHGLHCKHRFSGRYEVVLWFTKNDDYFFDLDSVRVKPKYPYKKHFKGPKIGQYSCNPYGKNPEDLWIIEKKDITSWDTPIWNIPNVKSNHIEKTQHPCQFPVALVERFVRSMCPKGGIVFDPFSGVASAGVASIINNRQFIGCEVNDKYIEVGKKRLNEAVNGQAKYRPFNKPIHGVLT